MPTKSIVEILLENKSKLDFSLVRDYPNSLELTRNNLIKLKSSTSTSLYITSITKKEYIKDTLPKLVEVLVKEEIEEAISK